MTHAIIDRQRHRGGGTLTYTRTQSEWSWPVGTVTGTHLASTDTELGENSMYDVWTGTRTSRFWSRGTSTATRRVASGRLSAVRV